MKIDPENLHARAAEYSTSSNRPFEDAPAFDASPNMPAMLSEDRARIGIEFEGLRDFFNIYGTRAGHPALRNHVDACWPCSRKVGRSPAHRRQGRLARSAGRIGTPRA